jgi:hypothetical protein
MVAGGCGGATAAGSKSTATKGATKGAGGGGSIRSSNGGPLGTNVPTLNFTPHTIKPPPPPTTVKHHYVPFHRVRRR